jgi:hypothetical protein
LLGTHRGPSAAELRLASERYQQALEQALEQVRSSDMGTLAALTNAEPMIRNAGAVLVAEAVSVGDYIIHGLIKDMLDTTPQFLAEHPIIVEALAARLATGEVANADSELLAALLNWDERLQRTWLQPLMAPIAKLIEQGTDFDLAEIARAACEFPECYPQLLEALTRGCADGNIYAQAASATALFCAPDSDDERLIPLIAQWAQRLRSAEGVVSADEGELIFSLLASHQHMPLGALTQVVDAWTLHLAQANANEVLRTLGAVADGTTARAEQRAPSERGYRVLTQAALDRLSLIDGWWESAPRTSNPTLSHALSLLHARTREGEAAPEAKRLAQICVHALAARSGANDVAAFRWHCAGELRANLIKEHAQAGESVYDTVVDDTPELAALAEVFAADAATQTAALARAAATALWEDDGRRVQAAADDAATLCVSEYRQLLRVGGNPEREGDTIYATQTLSQLLLADRKTLAKRLAVLAPKEWAQLKRGHRANARVGLLHRVISARMLKDAMESTFYAMNKEGSVFSAQLFALAVIHALE